MGFCGWCGEDRDVGSHAGCAPVLREIADDYDARAEIVAHERRSYAAMLRLEADALDPRLPLN